MFVRRQIDFLTFSSPDGNDELIAGALADFRNERAATSSPSSFVAVDRTL